jgi:ABC-2 type transport system ATP-binding protein
VGSVAVDIDHVSKHFKLYREKSQSLKERVIRAGRNPYDEFWALRDVSFAVNEGETVGLLGHNGSGKSTLLKCVAGTLRPTSGTVRVGGRLAALLELGSGFHPELTGRENLYLNGSILGFTHADIDAIFDEIVQFAELDQFIDQQVKHYSSGMYARLAFALAVNVDPDVFVVDEVLAVGDEAFQRKCMERIKGFQRDGRTILLVTHAADLVRLLCDRAAVLDHGELVEFGPPKEAVRAFRDTLIKRGIEIPEEAAETREERLTLAVRITSVRLEFPAGRTYLFSGEPLRITVAYEATRPVPDCVVALEIHDQEGNRLLGTNTEYLGENLGELVGRGSVTFAIDQVHLLDGKYLVSVGIHDRQGVEFDHRDQRDEFDVVSEGRLSGRVHFPMRAVHTPEPAPGAAARVS